MKKLYTLVFVCLSFAANAQFNFQHLYGGSNQERGQTLLETYNNMFLFNGATTSYGQGNADAIFIKNDNAGRIIWSKVYGLTDYDNSEFAIETPDFGYLAVGRSIVSIGSGFTDAWIYKTDSAGILQWSKAYGNPGVNDGFVQGINTADNGFTFIGNTRSIGVGSNDVFLVHTNAIGDTIFTRSFGSVESESGLSVIQTTDGGYAICGRQQTFPNGVAQSDGLIIRTDVNGDLLWANLYGDSLWEEFESIQELSNGRLVIAGSTVSFGQGNYDILMMMTDSAGLPLISVAYGGLNSDASYSVLVNTDNSLVISGYTDSYGYGHNLMGTDSTNIFLLKTDTTGQVLWMNTFGDGLQDEAFRSAKALDGGYMISGFTSNYIYPDSSQMLFIKTDSLGSSGCHEKFVTPLTSTNTMIFNPALFIQNSGVGVNNVNVIESTIITSDDDACLFANILSAENSDSFLIYPNPFVSELNLDLADMKGSEFSVKIIAANGTIVFSQSIQSNESINTANLADGLYCIILTSANHTFIQKIVKSAH